MDNIEEKFYKTFEIEKKCNRKTLKFCVGNLDCNTCKSPFYPKITDRILLELICIYNSTYTNGYTNYSLLNERNVEKLKEQILKNCLIVKDDIKPKIQKLFEGSE